MVAMAEVRLVAMLAAMSLMFAAMLVRKEARSGRDLVTEPQLAMETRRITSQSR